jgi:hypothetical protein
MSRTSGDDLMELDLTSTGGPVYGALAPLSHGINNQESTGTLQSPHSVSNVVDQMQPKRGLAEEIATDSEEGIKAPPKRESKRRRLPIRGSEEGISPIIASISKSSSQPTKDAPKTPPAWFSKFERMFLEKDFGIEWKDLVLSWASFEEKSRNTEVGRLPAAGRPKVVGMWIACRRTMTFLPNILSLKDYESEFNSWWKSLQPTW